MIEPRIVHQITDLEIKRTSALRTIERQVDLLTDGLHALRHGSPAVAEEFMDRSITALTAELVRLRSA